MDNEIGREAGVQIVGLHERMQVALLFEFPDPHISPCTSVAATVTDERGVTAQCDILLAEGRAYKVDSRILKESIYGSVRLGFILTRAEDGTYSYNTHGLVAVKIYSKDIIDDISMRCQEDYYKEFATMQFLGNDHPNIMGQLDCLEDVSHFYSIMPFCPGGELFDHVNTGGMPETKARKIFSQLLDGLEYMQSRGVAHRDISLENLLLTDADDEDSMCVKIIDWGMAVRVPRYRTIDGHRGFLTPPKPPCGKKKYMAPEVVANSRQKTAKPLNPLLADIWAVGVILFMLLTELPPFDVANETCKRFSCVTNGRLGALIRKFNFQLSDEVVDLMQLILQRDPCRRPTISEMSTHPWMVTTTNASS